MTLLIADDNDGIMNMLKNMAGRFFSEIFECSNGKTACELYVEKKPDWILMDILMSVMDGFEATRKIKGLNLKTKINITTSNDNTSFRKISIISGVVIYL